MFVIPAEKLSWHASMHIPQDEHEYICISVKAPALSPVVIPEFLANIRKSSVGICIYLVRGSRIKNVPSESE